MDMRNISRILYKDADIKKIYSKGSIVWQKAVQNINESLYSADYNNIIENENNSNKESITSSAIMSWNDGSLPYWSL